MAVLLTVGIVAIPTAGAQGSAKAAKSSHHKKGKQQQVTPTTLPPAADPLLTQAVKLAGQMVAEDHKAMAAAEKYDEEEIVLAKARTGAASASLALTQVSGRLRAANAQLAQAAVDAYVTDSSYSTAGLVLTNPPSDSQIVSTYAGVSATQLGNAIAALTALRDKVAADRTQRNADVAAAAQALVQIKQARLTAVASSAQAAHSLATVEQRLIHLLGPARAAQLLGLAAGEVKFKGPHLGGKLAGKIATAAQGRAAAAAAEKFIGVPYVWGGASKSGVDCSGLVMLAWASAGFGLEHGATMQWEESKPVSIGKLRPGDLLFYHFANDGPYVITHVVMYIGSGPYGAETVIQAASPGTTVAFAPIYFGGFVGAGRP